MIAVGQSEFISINIKLSPEMEKKLEHTLEHLEQSSASAFAAMERMAGGLERYAQVQTVLLAVLVGVCLITLAMLLVRDRQLRNVIRAAWRRLRFRPF